MERKKTSMTSLLLFWAAVSAIFSHYMVTSVMSNAAMFEDQKNFYYSPDPTPTVPHIPPPPQHGSAGGGHTTIPSHGTPPSHGGPGGVPPSHVGGGGSHGGTPPANCGNPPTGGSGNHHHHTPSPVVTPTPVVDPSPPVPIITVPPVVVVSPPTTPIIINPGTPHTPGITIPIPSPPFPFVPNSPPFTCTYWRNHPALIWGLFGWWPTTVGSAFGVTSLPGHGAQMDILQALSNTRSDGLGQLYREGTAALLNSIAHTRYPYTTSQVRDRFIAALGSNKAAEAQARIFKLANEGKAKPRA